MRAFFLLFCACTLLTSMADAAVVLLVEESAGHYRLEGKDLVDVVSIDLTLDYDQAGLNISSVTKGDLLQDMMFASNLNQPGLLRVGAVGTQAVKGSGTLAILIGASGSSPPKFNKLTVRLSSAKGDSLAVTTYLPTPDDSSNLPATSETSTTANRFGGSVKGLTPGFDGLTGTAIISDDHVSDDLTIPQNLVRGSRLTFIELREFAASSPLKLMKAYRGAHTYSAMSEIFTRNDQTILQHPYPALSDGKTEVKIILPALHHELPSIAVSNAKLLWSGVGENGEWIIRCLPFKDELSAKILVLGLEQLVEIPIVVAPSIDASLYPIDSVGITPKYDLNQDGKHTWEDDYILTVNLLVNDSEK